MDFGPALPGTTQVQGEDAAQHLLPPSDRPTVNQCVAAPSSCEGRLFSLFQILNLYRFEIVAFALGLLCLAALNQNRKHLQLWWTNVRRGFPVIGRVASLGRKKYHRIGDDGFTDPENRSVAPITDCALFVWLQTVGEYQSSRRLAETTALIL